MLKGQMKELGEFNLENRDWIGKYGVGSGNLQIIRGLPGRRGNLLCYRTG